jgi:triosephosphate isomerase
VARALKNNLKVIGCIGEKLEERENNQTFNVVKEQLDAFKS